MGPMRQTVRCGACSSARRANAECSPSTGSLRWVSTLSFCLHTEDAEMDGFRACAQPMTNSPAISSTSSRDDRHQSATPARIILWVFVGVGKHEVADTD